MVLWLAAAAGAQEVELGVGRAAVLRPHVAPTGVSVGQPSLLEVLPVPPTLVLFGREAGTTTLAIEHDGGRVEWTVTVHEGGAVAPRGTLVDPPGEPLALAPGEGAWCRIAGMRATTMLDLGVGAVQPFGDERALVQALEPGVADLVIETAKGPRVLTLTVAEGGGPALPPGCHRPTGIVQLRVGEALEVPVGRRVGSVVVGRPEIVAAAATPGAIDTLHLTALRSGRTTVLVRAREDEDPWARTVVVAPGP